MANYRPKSLDELNNLYGKSRNAQQEIVKKATVLEERSQPKEEQASAKEGLPEVKDREQAASEQISGYVNDFIKSFGTPAKPDRTAAATVTASMKTVPVGKPAEPQKESEAVRAAAEAHTDDKPRLIRNSERNSLFENYKKVMDDEDDYDFSEPDKDKRKPKKLFEKKAAKPADEAKSAEAEKDAEPAASKAEDGKAEETVEAPAAVKPPEEKKPVAVEVSEAEEEDTEEEPAKEKAPKAKKAKKAKKQKAPKQSKGTVSRAVVMLLIFCVLVCATAVGGIKAFSGINSDRLIMDKYRIYTADKDYSGIGVDKGSLVIVEHKGIDYHDVFAYKMNDTEFGFARLTSVLNDESVLADDGKLRCLVFNDSVRGVVYKTIPAVGAVAAFIMSDFLIALCALLALAVILMLIAAFGCKPKEKKEKKEKPEKAKKEKKSRKSKRSASADEGTAAEDADGFENMTDGQDEASDFDATEADFSFLLGDFDGEASDGGYADEAQEAYAEEAEAPAEEEPYVEEPAEEAPVKYEISDGEQDEEEELE